MMDLGERIKALRLEAGRTQEQLASLLGVTAQAVSRWENGICYPDMELIPSIANCFGVSIDALFGCENERTRRIDALAEQIIQMNRQNNGVDVNMDECVSLARSALIEFPGNEKLTFALASVLFNAGYVRMGEDHITDAEGFGIYNVKAHKNNPDWLESEKLYEKLLETLPAGGMRNAAVTELSQLYKNLGESEKALALADSAPNINASAPYLRINAFDGKAGVAACGEAILETIRAAAELTAQIAVNDHTLKPEEAAQILENGMKLFDLICPDGDHGRRGSGMIVRLSLLHSYFLWLSGDRDGAFGALNKALEHAKRFDEAKAAETEEFTSPLLRHVLICTGSAFDTADFAKELPEDWPWWGVPEQERVRAEMTADPRWNEWIKRAGGENL